MEIIVEALKAIKDEIETDETSEIKELLLTKNEKDFRSKVDSIYKVTTVTLTAATAVTVFFFPPFIFASAGLAVILALLHHYDKNNDYKLSHALAELGTSLFRKDDKVDADKKVIYIISKNRLENDGLNRITTKNNSIQAKKFNLSLSSHAFFAKKTPSNLAKEELKGSELEMARLKI